MTATAPVLTDKQRRVLELVVEGHTNPEIAAALGLHLNTVKAHVRALQVQLGAPRKRHLIRLGRDWLAA